MAWYQRLLNLLRSERVSHEIDRELDFHLAETADRLQAGGMSERAAQHEARRRLGNYGLQKERTRDADILPWLESLMADLRYGLRALRMSPVLALVAIGSLGLGIGANTGIFSLINAVILRPLPVRQPQELVRVTFGNERSVFTNPQWEQLRDRQDVFAGAFAMGNASFDVSTGGEARRLTGNWVSGDYFAALGVQPVLGRVLTAADDRRGCAPTAVLSHGLWQSEYGGSTDVIGKTILLSERAFEIVGVTPSGFTGVTVGRSIQVFTPLCAISRPGPNSMLDARSTWFLHIVARLKPGVTIEQARARVSALAPSIMAATLPPRWSGDQQRDYLQRTLDLTPAANGLSFVRESYRRALYILMGLVSLVLLIACANVANLLLARATTRQGEMAIRLSIGAGRARIVRQLLTESVLLSMLGAAAGVVFAGWSSRVLAGFLARTDPAFALDLSLDLRVFAFTVAVAALTGILFGLAPAWRALRVDPQTTLKAGGRGIVEGQSRFNLGKALVVAQVALSMVLVTGAALLVSTFWRLVTLDPGFEPEHVLVLNAETRKLGTPADQRLAFQQRILEQLRAVPGVRSASSSDLTPISGSTWNNQVEVAGFAPQNPDAALTYFNRVTDGYFATMGMTILAGRDFRDSDRPGSERVAVINETMARRFFGSVNALGREFRTRVAAGESSPPIRVIAVVRDAKYESLREEMLPTAFLSLYQEPEAGTSLTFELRAAAAPAQLIPSIKAAVATLNPGIALEFTTLDDQVATSLTQERLLAVLSGFFGVLALLLAMIGLYGTMSYQIERRRREIGIRIAFGAGQPRVLRMVFGQVGAIVTSGIALGLIASLAATRLVSSFLYGIQPREPVALLLAALILFTVAMAAGLPPARRAARLDPMIALRE